MQPTPHSAGRHYREILRVSLPLMATMGATLVMEFTDRMFLAGYAVDAISAAMPAGLLAFLFIVLAAGMVGYVSVFIAQYAGAGRVARIGAYLWQALWLALAAGAALAVLSFAGAPLFALADHPAPVQELENIYFSILMRGAFIHVLGSALAGFFTGLGATRPVMVFHAAGTLVNIPLDYCLINGFGPFPELGILGAALATVAAWAVTTALLAGAVFSRSNDRIYKVRRSWRLRPDLIRELAAHGLPAALQMTLDLVAFSFFVLMIGRIDRHALAVTNIVMAINSLAFMPMLGVSMGTSTLVGQAMGRNDPALAEAFTRQTLNLVYLYLAAVALLFLGLPEMLIGWFRPPDLTAAEFARLEHDGVWLLRLVTAYIFCDAQYMIYVGALKGAGDTRFVGRAVGLLSLVVMGIPLGLGISLFEWGVYEAWGCATAFIFSLFWVFQRRFRAGRWKSMRLIGARDGGMSTSSPPAARTSPGA